MVQMQEYHSRDKNKAITIARVQKLRIRVDPETMNQDLSYALID
jgi:hypothetical protein